ncbi:tetratricopeptide repeat protein [Yersinia rohdei]|uniref:hypothetical protein n=1 Tax=Yersinia rohdei TaxID=29485 RepID=UPI00119DA868|nr:hypothetical protein [Yersinia rohdei]
MAIAPKKGLNEILEMLTSCIDERNTLDVFTLRRVVSSTDKIPDEPTRLMVLGLAYGAAGEHKNAIGFFKEAVKYQDDIVARNYLSYLSHTGQYELYRNEAVKMAKEIVSLPLYIRARNAAYADGDGELSLFFARKALSMISDKREWEKMDQDIRQKTADLDKFISVTKLSTSEISELALMVALVGEKHGVVAVSHDYYTSSDGDAAIVCDVFCTDVDVLSEMDITAATEIAISENFSNKNVTAWYRGKDRKDLVLNT